MYQTTRKCFVLFTVLCLILSFQFQLTVFKTNSQLPTVEIQWTYQTNAPIFSSPAVADLTNDGKLDLIFCSMENTFALDSEGKLIWNNTDINRRLFSTATPAIIDIDGNNSLEIIVDSFNYGVYCVNRFGEIVWFHEERFIVTSPVIADLDNNGDMEIIFATNQRILCLNSSGLVKWNYTVEVSYLYSNQFALADLDDSGDVEILINTKGNELLCLNADGTKAWTSSYLGMPITADLDGDKSKEIILSSHDQVTCLNSTGGLLWEFVGGSGFTVLGVANIINDVKNEVIVCSDSGKSVICINWRGEWEWTYFADDTPTSLCIADISGDGRLEIIVGTDYNSLFCLSANKELLWEFSLSDEFLKEVAYPCIIDLDNDGILEIIFAHFQTAYCLKVKGISESGIAPWYCKGGTVFRTGTLDSDGDYMDDLSEETWLQTDSYVRDSDSDYLTDGEEFLCYHTDPTNPDTDGDGFLDGEEIIAGTDPLNPDDNLSIRRKLITKKVLLIIIPIIVILSVLLIISKKFIPRVAEK
ncbi:MAG TPA: hypothetical protein VMX55_15025 [candidate division Zixibacteria bacterium]|nr:hypothetical protein [candidate division Zixibacteria bacterium]